MRTDADYLQDMVDASERVIGYVAGVTREAFDQNRMLQDAVLYRLAVIGEAATHIGESTRARVPTLPWKQITRMRNILVHDYFGVDLNIAWDTATRYVHELIVLVKPLVHSLGQSKDPDAAAPE
jgi:uncharacterized protein with HEPN domain